MWELLAGNCLAALLRNALGRWINITVDLCARGGASGDAGSGASSLFLDQNEVRRVKKNNFGGRPPSFLGVWMSGHHLLEDTNIRPCYSLRESCPSGESREVTHEQHAKGDARGLGVGRR